MKGSHESWGRHAWLVHPLHGKNNHLLQDRQLREQLAQGSQVPAGLQGRCEGSLATAPLSRPGYIKQPSLQVSRYHPLVPPCATEVCVLVAH